MPLVRRPLRTFLVTTAARDTGLAEAKERSPNRTEANGPGERNSVVSCRELNDTNAQGSL
jgi:hypothetical protein